MTRDNDTPKIGAGHASAMFRLGISELRAAAAFADSNIVQPTPYGMYGVATPQEVLADKQGEQRDPDESPSVLDERLKQAEQQRYTDKGREPESPQQERE